ncbi:MAG: tetratricopeptide repeat protein, partial [Armatimonadota bacterium]|nr:tetratricopeptide repeat protein [Armatimonadota bacterium]
VCAEAAVEIGQILVSDNKKNYDQAIIQFSEVLNEYKDERAACAQALFGLAKAQERAGKIDDALASYQRLITDFSDVKNQYSVQAYYMKGNLYERIGQKEKAITEYNNIIKFYPSKARGLRVKHKIAALLQTSPVSDDTRAELQTAFEQFSAFQADKSAKEAIEQARTKAMVGDRAGAKADLTALGASEAVNNSIELLGMIARISISFGEKEKAASAFAKQLQLAAAENRPKRYGILRLQSSYFLGDYATAISEAETLLAQYSEDAAGITLRYYMARSYDRMNSVESALAAYDDFISRYSKATDKPTLEMVAMALARSAYRLSGQGKISEAIEKYKRVITECPETEMAFSATNSLKKLEERSGQ